MHQLYIHPVDDDDQNIPFIFLYSYSFFSYGFFTRPSVKKLFLSKAFGLIVLCFSLNSAATTFQTQERICPIGGERFTENVIFHMLNYLHSKTELDNISLQFAEDAIKKKALDSFYKIQIPQENQN